MAQEIEYTFHGIRCVVYTSEETLKYYPVMPWRFRIFTDSGFIQFVGIPNYCTSRRSAMMRAKARCKWIADGTYSQRYS